MPRSKSTPTGGVWTFISEKEAAATSGADAGGRGREAGEAAQAAYREHPAPKADYRRDQERLGAEQMVYMEGLIDRKGKPFNAYVRPNHERGKYDFSRKRPEESQIHEIKPDNASRTQVAVNSEGKTHEATKHVGEPLQRGQTAPANEEQQRRQQNANRPRMKM